MTDAEKLCRDIAKLEGRVKRTYCSRCGRDQDTLAGEGNPINGGRRKSPSVHGCLRGKWFDRAQDIPDCLTDPAETVRMQAIKHNVTEEEIMRATAEAYRAMLEERAK